jgi:hypothetical protein
MWLAQLPLPLLALMMLPDAAAGSDSHARGTPAGQLPDYPIPSSCNFVTPQDTGGRNINRAFGHYFCRPRGTPTKQLLVFLPGTGTNDYMSVVKTAASVGMHAVSLDWDNHPCAAAACTMGMKPPVKLNATIANCTFNLQMSRLVGSSDVPVTNIANDTIVGRAVMLLDYLSKQEPAAADWAQFILPTATYGSKLAWDKVIVWGHSRGASYPPLVSKLFPAQRAIMTGGDGAMRASQQPIAPSCFPASLPPASVQLSHGWPAKRFAEQMSAHAEAGLCAIWTCLLVDLSGDSDEVMYLPFWQRPSVMRTKDLYSLNPAFNTGFGHPVGAQWFFASYEGKRGFNMSGNGTFSPSDLVGTGAAVGAALAKKFGGARAIWDEGAE